MPFNEKGLLAKNSEAYYAAFYGTTPPPMVHIPLYKAQAVVSAYINNQTRGNLP